MPRAMDSGTVSVCVGTRGRGSRRPPWRAVSSQPPLGRTDRVSLSPPAPLDSVRGCLESRGDAATKVRS